jgi:hypothetical protein
MFGVLAKGVSSISRREILSMWRGICDAGFQIWLWPPKSQFLLIVLPL